MSSEDCSARQAIARRHGFDKSKATMAEPTSAPKAAEEIAFSGERPALPAGAAWTLVIGLGLGIWLWDVGLHRRPEMVTSEGWRLLAIFLPIVLALMLRPIPGGAVVLLGLIVIVLTGALPIEKALKGYSDPTVWLVLAAYFISRALIKTGLARRIALTFVRLLGRNTLGLSYALVASDTVLAGMIPSNAARVGGVILPITRSLAELYQSFPGKSAGLLGTFLMLTLYQADIIACALFLTGQASNVLAANQAAELTKDVAGGPVILSYGLWFWGALLPASVSLLLVPWLIYRWVQPAITHTPAAAEFARAELTKMGRPNWDEWIVILVFLGVCTLWIISDAKMTTIIALAGAGVLLLSGVLSWKDCVTEHKAWDVFIWYGGLVQLGKELEEANLTSLFAQTIAERIHHWPLAVLFLAMLLIYFYAHYGFASITTHILSMYPAFVKVLLALGAPPALTVACFAYFANFSAGLTHYGTTPAPIIFSVGYVSHGTWWRVGFGLSLVNVAIWLTVGMAWWKWIGWW